MPNPSTFLGEINPQSIILADGRHFGVVELRVCGLPINRLGVEHFESTTSVTGVDTIYACRDKPVLRVAVTAKGDGSNMTYDEIKAVASSLAQALQAWAVSLAAEEVDQFTRIREVQFEPTEGLIEHGEVTIYEMDGNRS